MNTLARNSSSLETEYPYENIKIRIDKRWDMRFLERGAE